MTANQANVLYLVNLIDAELRLNETGSDEWKDADLDAILAKDESIARKPRTFGQKIASAASRGVGFYVDSEYRLEWLNDYRREIAHSAETDREPSRDLSEIAYKAGRIARASTGRNFDFVGEFARLDRAIRSALWTLGRGVGDEIGTAIVSIARSKGLSPVDVKWLWRYINLRNRHVHTGATLSAAERRFVASVETRLRKLIAKEIGTKAGLARIRAEVVARQKGYFGFGWSGGLDYRRQMLRKYRTKSIKEAFDREVEAEIERIVAQSRDYLAK